MTTTNKRLSGPSQVSGTASIHYETPPSCVTILQHIHVSNPLTTSVAFTMSLGPDGAARRIYDAYSIPGGAVLDVFCKYVLANEEEIEASASVANVLILTLDGQELTPG